ncbi:DUF481 domain-containing protein [Glaciecola petra]|uniref:DUF481 domain-containing protein n=1 Tax=Glaciecola petra TaxID=3075602 RepID=A0ABU2ZM99_9ALTE|nr:DUF481 domain-containing protein [Aestuariibacter sp. P117]MDT0593525.1 DUF481 domain-containing protein [Aestuariibacter sp. P117]
MLKKTKTSLLAGLFAFMCMSIFCCGTLSAQQKASDFFKNPSKEKNILTSLFDRKNDNKKRKKDVKPFTLAGEAGLLTTTGNTETSIIKVAMESTHELKNWSNRYQSQFLQRTNTVIREGEKVDINTRRLEISAQLDYKLLKDSNRLFVYAEYDDNEFNRLRDQATLVLGWSQVMWQKDRSQFRYSIGPGYSHLLQDRTDTRIEEMIVRGTVYYNHIFRNDARFVQTVSAELGEVISKARTRSSLSAKVFDKLAMKFSVDLIYNDNVASQDSVLSTQTSVSMVYQFF